MAVANAPASPLNLPQPPQSWNTGWQQRYTQALTQASLNWLTKGNDILLDANTTLTLTSADGTTQVTIVANDDGTIGPIPAAPASLLPQNNTWTGTNTFDAAVTVNAATTAEAITSTGGVTLTGTVGTGQLVFQNTTSGLGYTYSFFQGPGGNLNGNAITSGGVATNWLTLAAAGGTPSSLTLAAPTITLTGTVHMTNTASVAQTLGNTANVFGNPNADWGALSVVNLGTTNSPSIATVNGIHFRCTATGNVTIAFPGLYGGASGSLTIYNSTGSAISVGGGSMAAGMNTNINSGTFGVFTYFYNNTDGAVFVGRMY